MGEENIPRRGEERESPAPEILSGQEAARAVRKFMYPNWADILAFLGMFFFSSVAAAFVGGLFFPNFSSGGFGLFAVYVIQFSIMIAFALVLKKYRTGTFRHVMRLSWKGFDPKVILWGLVLMLAVSAVVEPVADLFPDEWIGALNEKVLSGGWAMLTTVVAAPVCEEILFRGILQDSTVRKFGAWKGILLASFLFGLVHVIPQQIVDGFCLGIVIGYIYYRTGSLFSAVVLHAINNTLALFLLLFEEEETKNRTLREFIGSDTVYFLIYAVSAVLIVVALTSVVRLIRKGRLSAEGVAEKNAGDR